MATLRVRSRNYWALLASWATLLNHPRLEGSPKRGAEITREANLFNIAIKIFNHG
jgi:hypothetical protein